MFPPRVQEAHFRLDQVARALAHGIRVEAWTFDEWYGRDGEFREGLERLGQNYVGEVPATLTWEAIHRPPYVTQRSHLLWSINKMSQGARLPRTHLARRCSNPHLSRIQYDA